jgi:hypothetical protein
MMHRQDCSSMAELVAHNGLVAGSIHAGPTSHTSSVIRRDGEAAST